MKRVCGGIASLPPPSPGGSFLFESQRDREYVCVRERERESEAPPAFFVCMYPPSLPLSLSLSQCIFSTVCPPCTPYSIQ